MIPEALIDAALAAYGDHVSVGVSNRPMEYADVYRAHITAALEAALAWRDESGPYLYTRDQLEQVGWLHTRAGGLVAYRQDTTADEHIWTLANGWVAVYRLRENREPPRIVSSTTIEDVQPH